MNSGHDNVSQLFKDGVVFGVAMRLVSIDTYEVLLEALSMIQLNSEESKDFIDGMIEGTRDAS